MKKALITGITGQDGRYLATLLLEKDYEITGVSSGSMSAEGLDPRIMYVQGNIADESFVKELLSRVRPDEVYNLAAIVTTAKPWEKILDLVQVNAVAPLFFLEWIRSEAPATRFFQASSSYMFGVPSASPQSETTPFLPQNPYGITKVFAHQMVGRYREEHKLFAVSGILFNHESPIREEKYVTRKITSTLARIAGGSEEILELGNLESTADWSFAGDIIEGIWMSLQAETPDDYVFALGESHTVREFVGVAARALGLSLRWEGEGVEEKGVTEDGRVLVRINPAFMRPAEGAPRRGDISKAHTHLGWEPRTSFEGLVGLMLQADRKGI